MVKFLLRMLMLIGLVILVLVVNYILFGLNAHKISEGVPIENADPQKVALLVIDIQEGITGTVSFTDGYIEQSESFIGRVNQVIEDSYDSGHTLIYIKSEIVNPLINVLNNTLARGSEGADFDKRLLIKPGHVISKRKSDSFRNTELDQILTEKGIGKLVLVGLDAGECVNSTFLAARNRGYAVTIVENAVIAEDEASKNEALENFREMGVELISVD